MTYMVYYVRFYNMCMVKIEMTTFFVDVSQEEEKKRKGKQKNNKSLRNYYERKIKV